MAQTKRKAALATTKTSHQTIDSCSVTQRRVGAGFTLLEVIITVAIIAAIVTMALPRLGSRSNEIRSTVRKLSTLSRELRSRAKLNNTTYRLVINMEDAEKTADASRRTYTYWVEKAHGEVLNDYDPENPPSLDPEENDDEEAKKQPLFSPDTQIMKKPEELPGELIFESVELATLDEPVTTGIVYIHYLPTGFVDEAAIHLRRGDKIAWTLAIEPLTGRMDVIDEYRALEDLRAK